jgi:hypothetical protein
MYLCFDMSSRHKLNRCEGVGKRTGTCMGEVRCTMGMASRIIVDSWVSLFFFPSVCCNFFGFLEGMLRNIAALVLQMFQMLVSTQCLV